MTGVLAGALGLVVGLVIGTLGGGGGVLSVPALVYALGQDARTATTGSIVIVGIISAAGVLARLRGRTIDWRTGVGFGIVGVPTAWAGSLVNRDVPQPVLLLSFAALTLLIAVLMLVRGSSSGPPDDGSGVPAAGGGASGATAVLEAPTRRRATVRRVVKIAGAGSVVGFLTGFLGVGGGFLVVPALTVLMGLPMSAAIGTSLLVLTFNSISSMGARIGHLDLDWALIGPFAAVAVLGALGGKLVADRMSGAALNRAFAGLLVAVGLFVGVQSLLAL
ncbi:sulfite exporter TauE/SafE family protein [Pseudonocardia sp. DR1-2]|uniref:sulfite exporter TauE/SafE family protein n=1 Tax=Pseudonocardia sp. DR1-2 TaxID=2951168 RepID=UPI0020447BD6|nr:sulfite exporter TauE/SafE family protein [Pseudonocardia sp. DR1-2]MCM3845730.1 sulfite exporter TauE/SafE family protein [Pseudonocardia sp. DR1-2]